MRNPTKAEANAVASLIGHRPENAPDLYTRIVYSPDDGGYYAYQHDRDGRDVLVSKKIYRIRDNLQLDLRLNRVRWEKA